MLAFTARATTTKVDVDGVEIVEASWFTRDQLRTAIASGTVKLPMRASVAYYLIDGWLSATQFV